VRDDAILIQKCLAGNEAAMRAFTAKYQNLVYSLCLRMLGHREDAEDVAQESFLRIFRALDRWDPSRPVKPWLLTIVANRCRTALTRRSKLPVSNDTAMNVEIERREHSKHAREQIDIADELQVALSGLREEYQLCFVMFYQQELSYEEIAEILDRPQGTVKTWLHRARAQITDCFRQRGVLCEVPS